MNRQKIVAGNWKMHKTLEESQALITEVRGIVRDEYRGEGKVVLIPTFWRCHRLFDCWKAADYWWGLKMLTRQIKGHLRVKFLLGCSSRCVFNIVW